MNFLWKVGNGPVNKWLNFRGDPRITVWIHGLFSGFVTIGRYGTDIATLVRPALAEVCTVPLLLVITGSKINSFSKLFRW